jgi:spore germination cell wall hydrolase CwlJ-like protein
MLVSFTADAGQDAASDWNMMSPLTIRTLATRSGSLSHGSPLSGDIGLYGQTSTARLQTARLAVGAPEDLHSLPDELEPHVDLKPNVKYFPQVDRTKKGDPVVGMRPSFDTRLKSLIHPEDDLAFRIGGDAPAVALAPRHALPGDELLNETLEASVDSTEAITQRADAAASPAQSGSAPTASASDPALDERISHGATPPVSRAVALGSSTPAQPDAVPIEVAAFPEATIALGTVGKGIGPAQGEDERPDYAALIDQGKMDREKRCLAEAVYFESRSEPEQGQAAVAQVVLNRVSSGLYPSTVCGVVYQNRHHYHRCQFSFACEGRSLRITERESWAIAVRVASEVMDGRTYVSDVGRSTHYHANYVKPRWARHLKRMERIGHHIFYRLKPGQT